LPAELAVSVPNADKDLHPLGPASFFSAADPHAKDPRHPIYRVINGQSASRDQTAAAEFLRERYRLQLVDRVAVKGKNRA
jgi:hypothetical protein